MPLFIPKYCNNLTWNIQKEKWKSFSLKLFDTLGSTVLFYFCSLHDSMIYATKSFYFSYVFCYIKLDSFFFLPFLSFISKKSFHIWHFSLSGNHRNFLIVEDWFIESSPYYCCICSLKKNGFQFHNTHEVGIWALGFSPSS